MTKIVIPKYKGGGGFGGMFKKQGANGLAGEVGNNTGSGTDMDGIQNGIQNGLGIAGANGQGIQAGAMLTEAVIPKKKMAYGVEVETGGAAIGRGLIDGGAEGAKMGSAFGPWGAAVGGVVGSLYGGISGAIGNDKAQKAAQELVKKRRSEYFTNQNEASLTAYAEKGAKLVIPKFAKGGTTSTEEKAVILGGLRHEEKGDLGKGNPIVKLENGGKKVAETEVNELLMTLPQTQQIELLIEEGDMVELGRYVKHLILHETKNNSDRFKL